MLLIIQWNARSLIANGQEFKSFIDGMVKIPDAICIQETWLRLNLDFVIQGYVAVRRDRKEGGGEGCVTFIKQGLPYRILGLGKELEYVAVKVWIGLDSITIINFYNPCRRLDLNTMEEVEGQDRRKVVWCVDFNAHSPLWGGKKLDRNGQVIEELLDLKGMVCLNDGRGTRIDMVSGNESALDLTITSNDLARLCEWEVWKDSTVGSDNFPILCSVQMRMERQSEEGGRRLVFGKANWEKFKELCEERLDGEVRDMDIDKEYNSFQEIIKGVAD